MEDKTLFEDDGLYLPEVGPWALSKHKKIGYYSAIFAASMKKKWDCRVYLDLFSSAGKCKIKGTNEVVPGSPLLALSVDVPFDRYIFCEEKSESMDALQKRVEKYYPERECSFILGNTNSAVNEIINAVPEFNRNYRGLTFCFVDPYKMDELKFDTIRKLAKHLYIDFLILIPTFMDINRNEKPYTSETNWTIDTFLGNSEWRAKWANRNDSSTKFGNFITEQFCDQMKNLGFLYETPKDLELIRMPGNIPLYHLGFFSTSKLGLKFWRETMINTTDQIKLF